MKLLKIKTGLFLFILLLSVGSVSAQLPDEPNDPDGAGDPLNPAAAPIENSALAFCILSATGIYILSTNKWNKIKN